MADNEGSRGQQIVDTTRYLASTMQKLGLERHTPDQFLNDVSFLRDGQPTPTPTQRKTRDDASRRRARVAGQQIETHPNVDGSVSVSMTRRSY